MNIFIFTMIVIGMVVEFVLGVVYGTLYSEDVKTFWLLVSYNIKLWFYTAVCWCLDIVIKKLDRFISEA